MTTGPVDFAASLTVASPKEQRRMAWQCLYEDALRCLAEDVCEGVLLGPDPF